MRILLERERNKTPQISLIELDPIEEPVSDDRQARADVVDGARIQLMHEYGRPYYYGFDKLADASNANIEQFITLCSSLIDVVLAQIVRGKPVAMKAKTQHESLVKRSKEIIKEWDFPYHVQVHELVEMIGKRCVESTTKPNAPLSDGANAIGIPQSDFDNLSRSDRVARVLHFAFAYKALTLVPNYRCKGKEWALLELGGIGSTQDWTCPCCCRSKFAISRRGNSGQILAKLVIHHDHMGEVLEAAFNASFRAAGTSTPQVDGKRLVERIGTAFAAYEEVLVCEDCNNADTSASKMVGTAANFSFSPRQISRFVRPKDHSPHEIDQVAAQDAWRDAKAAYELRMKIIRAVGHAAATDSHWYEPSADKSGVPVFGYRSSAAGRLHDRTIQEWISADALVMALGPAKPAKLPNLARWRTSRVAAKGTLPNNYVAMLKSDPQTAKVWDGLSDTWRCPTCHRSKAEVACPGDKGKVRFPISQNRARGNWSGANTICGHCNSTLMSLKYEVVQLLGRPLPDSYAFVSPGELATVIEACPHGPNRIRSDAAAALVQLIVSRSN
ncbi:MAG: hypothetical protein ACT4P0_10260 [Panacagrimonas sp.]